MTDLPDDKVVGADHKAVGEVGDLMVHSFRWVESIEGLDDHIYHSITVYLPDAYEDHPPSMTMTPDEALKLIGVLFEAINHGSQIKRIPIQEFVDVGFLQEANRLFFHPVGLALEVQGTTEGEMLCLGGVWDYRHDPEGMAYGDNVLDEAKAARVRDERLKHVAERTKLWGVVVQPFTDKSEPGETP